MHVNRLPNRCTVAQLHQWLMDVNEGVPRALERVGTRTSREVLKAIHALPGIQSVQREWANARPFPSDSQLVLMAVLFSPGQRLSEIDETALYAVEYAVTLMSGPEPVPEAVWIDIAERSFQMDERVTVVNAS